MSFNFFSISWTQIKYSKNVINVTWLSIITKMYFNFYKLRKTPEVGGGSLWLLSNSVGVQQTSTSVIYFQAGLLSNKLTAFSNSI